MLWPDLVIASSQALQFKGALALTHPKGGSSLCHTHKSHMAKRAGSHICTAFERSVLIWLTKAFMGPQAEQGRSSLRPTGKPEAIRETRAPPLPETIPLY